MSRAKDPIEVGLAAIVKTARTGIRLKHSLAADAEINEKIPEIEASYFKAVQQGRQFSLKKFEL